jgi:hypothetical protein
LTGGGICRDPELRNPRKVRPGWSPPSVENEIPSLYAIDAQTLIQRIPGADRARGKLSKTYSVRALLLQALYTVRSETQMDRPADPGGDPLR